ncbi:MAG: RDD family protein [Rhizobiales bacterium]|nr:RDD family protein [Rhizobacter sp.]
MTAAQASGAGALMAPSLKRRMASFVYEGLLLFGIGLIPGVIGALFVALTGHQHPLQSDTALRVITLTIYAVYFGWFWSKRGQTLPMQTWHIKVVTAVGGPVSQPRALLRFIAACAWFAPAALIASLNDWTRWQGLGAIAVGVLAYALLALLHPQRQFWHDALCGTRLIDARPGAPAKA